MRRIFPAVLLALLLFGGCQKKSAVKTPVPPPVPAPAGAPAAVTVATPSTKPAPLEPAPLGKTISAPNSFELGEKNFVVGNYQQAAAEFEDFLSDNPKSKDRDQALFHLGLSRVLATDSNRDMRKAEAAFRQLVAEFPNSHYKTQAEFILGLQVQIEKLRSDVKERDDRIKKLSEELKVLREIDLQRRPSRPD